MNRLVIDGNNLFWRYASIGDDPMAGTSWFLKALRDVDQKCGVRFGHRVLVAEPVVKDRVAEPDGYKSQRPPVDAAVAAAFERARAVFPHMDHGYIYAEDQEADGLIASLVLHAAAAYPGDRIHILSSDKDLCQLVDDARNVRVVRPEREWQHFTAADVSRRYGVPPHRISLYLSLCGDKSDNIPGVPGWGETWAARAASAAATLEGVLELPAIPARLKASLQEHWERTRRHWRMIHLQDLPPVAWPEHAPNRNRRREAVRGCPQLAWLGV